MKLTTSAADEVLQRPPMNDTEDLCDLPLTRQALASVMVRFLNHPGNILTNEAIDGGQPLISEVLVNRKIEITINGKKYSKVKHLSLHWNSDLLVIGFLNNDGLLAKKAMPIDGIFQFEVAEDNEDFLSPQELKNVLH